MRAKGEGEDEVADVGGEHGGSGGLGMGMRGEPPGRGRDVLLLLLLLLPLDVGMLMFGSWCWLIFMAFLQYDYLSLSTGSCAVVPLCDSII